MVATLMVGRECEQASESAGERCLELAQEEKEEQVPTSLCLT